MKTRWYLAVLAITVVSGCAALENLRNVLQAPRFAVASGRQAELRLLGPSSQRPTGGATIRLWARVENPNSISLTLSQLAGNLFLENNRAADVSLPLGLPLVAGQDTVIPLDVTVSFSDLPGLADMAARILTRASVAYRLDGTVAVDAGVFGRPTFGPSTLLRGDVVVRR